MAFSSNGDLLAKYNAGGRHLSVWHKFTDNLDQIAGGAFDLSMSYGGAGIPRQNIYPGGMLESTRLWYKSAGSMWHGANVSPATKHVLTLGGGCGTAVNQEFVLTLCDYLMFYPLVDMDNDGLQEFDNTITLPRYPDGLGVRAMLIATSDTGPNAHSINVSYTNSDGVSGRTMPMEVSCIPSTTYGRIVHCGARAKAYGPFLPLAEGDKGVLSMQSIQLSAASGSGWAALVLVKPLCVWRIAVTLIPFEKSLLRNTPCLPRVKDEAFLNYVGFGQSTTANSYIWGYNEIVYG